MFNMLTYFRLKHVQTLAINTFIQNHIIDCINNNYVHRPRRQILLYIYIDDRSDDQTRSLPSGCAHNK